MRRKIKKLRDVLPPEAMEADFDGQKFRDYLDEEVLIEVDGFDTQWPGTHKNIITWWMLKNGFAVGLNENPYRGISFPVVRAREKEEVF